MRKTYECSRSLSAESKVDYFAGLARIRGNAMFVVARPERVRLDVFSPFGVTLSTLTANAQSFALLDLREKAYYTGPANTCNVARFLNVPIPPHALVELFTGLAPVLTHSPADATIAWDSGAFTIRIDSKHDSHELIRLAPHPDDWNKPWAEQRVRVFEVSVEQKNVPLYHVELGDHEPAPTAKPRVDPDGIDPDIPPSGPVCRAEVPRKIRFEAPASNQDVLFTHKEVVHNPPLKRGVFVQTAPRGIPMQFSECRSL